MTYYEFAPFNPTKLPPVKGSIPLTNSCKVEGTASPLDGKHTMILKVPKMRDFVFTISTEDELKSWVETLSDVIAKIPSNARVSTDVVTKPAPKKQQKKTENVFGSTLIDVMERQRTAGLLLLYPQIINDSILYLDNDETLKTEGLFRLSGSAMLINDLKSQVDKGNQADLSQVNDPHAVAGLLKMYLRELPEPLCTFEFYNTFIEKIQIKI